MAGYVALYRKYRPGTFADLVGQEPVARTLASAIAQSKLGHAYLFCGPRGTGKTSVARILAKSVNCAQGPTAEPCGTCSSCREITLGNNLDVIEIDAASNNGVDNIRDLQDRVALAPVGGRYKIYIIDEVHMLSQGAFNALLKTLEEPPPNVLFVLATTDPHKVLPTIVSRCQRFDFGRIGLAALIGRLAYVAGAEGIPAEAGALEAIARRANGGLRDALSLLDQLAAATGGAMLTAEAVAAGLGLVSGDQIVALGEALVRGDVPTALELSQGLLAAGHEHGTIMRELLTHFRHLMVLQLAPDRASQLDVPIAHQDAMRGQAAALPAAELPWILEVLNEAEGLIRRSPQQAIWLELGLIKVARRPVIASLVELSERVAALEAAMGGGQALPARPSPRPALQVVAPAPAPVPVPVAAPVALPPAAAPTPAPVAPPPTAAPIPVPVALPPAAAPIPAPVAGPLADPLAAPAFDDYLDVPPYDDGDVPPPLPDDNFAPLPPAPPSPAAFAALPPAPPGAFDTPALGSALPPRPPLGALSGGAASPTPVSVDAAPTPPPASFSGAQRPIPPGAWERVIDYVRSKSVPTAAMLTQQASVERWDADGAVILRMGKAFKETFDRTASKKQILLDAVAVVFGGDAFPRIEVGDGKGPPGGTKTKSQAPPGFGAPAPEPAFNAPPSGFGSSAPPGFGPVAGGIGAGAAFGGPAAPVYAPPAAPAYAPPPAFAPPASFPPPPPPSYDDPPPPDEPPGWLDDFESSRPPDVRPDEATAVARPPVLAPGAAAQPRDGGPQAPSAEPLAPAAAKPAQKPAPSRGSGGGENKGEYRRRGQEAPPPPRPPLKLPDDPALRLAVELFNGRVVTPTEAG